MIDASLKHSSFGNNKAHKMCIARTKTIILEFNRLKLS